MGLVRGGTPGSPTDPLLAGACGLQSFAEPAWRSFAQPFSFAVGLPPGKARLRRRIAVALGRLRAFGAFLLLGARQDRTLGGLFDEVEYTHAVHEDDGAA
jgi:hypothetical protein